MSDLQYLRNYIDDTKQFRNRGCRNLAIILMDLMNENKKPLDTIIEDVPETSDELDETVKEIEETEPETAFEPEPEPAYEPEPEPEPEMIFKMDDLSVGTVEEDEDSEMMDTMSLLEVSVAGDVDCQDGSMELVQIGGYTYEQRPCKACLSLRDKKSYKGGNIVPFRWFEIYCGQCQRSQYKLYKSQKAEQLKQKKIMENNNRIIGNRSIQQRNIEDLRSLRSAKTGADTTEMKNGIKECVKRGQPVNVTLLIK